MMSILRARWPLSFVSWNRLTGPLFDKDLRVAGRRRRSYALRCAYVVVLMTFIASVWISAVQLPRQMALQRAQMELAAKTITRGIVWFQFIAAQVVVVMTMSTAISDEVYGRTLGVLMTTPLSSFQLVMGKLFSRLFQILLLVATSLPLLAIVRVLGGIPWDYLLLSLTITLVTVIFVGSMSLFFSTLCRRVYVAAILSALTVAFWFGVLPFLANMMLSDPFSDRQFTRLFSHVNPYILLQRCTENMISPRRGAIIGSISGLICCCTFLLFGAAAFLFSATRLVRLVALRRVMGQPTFLDLLRPSRLAWSAETRARRRTRGIRRVVGPAMVWKELTCTLSRRQKLAANLTIGVEVLLVGIAYAFPIIMPALGYEVTHLVFLWTFLSLGVLFTTSVSATVICSERESRTWPLLLVTPLRNRDILLGKCAGVLRRCGPIWLPLLAYVVAFSYADCFHGWAVIQVILVVVSAFVFLTATGFYFGMRFERTSEAVTANLLLAGAVWCVLPLVGHWAMVARGSWDDGRFFVGVPFAQMLFLVQTTLEGGDGRIYWFGYPMNVERVTVSMLVSTLAHVLVAFLFLGASLRAFRRRVT